jgi:hypothetical protein
VLKVKVIYNSPKLLINGQWVNKFFYSLGESLNIGLRVFF